MSFHFKDFTALLVKSVLCSVIAVSTAHSQSYLPQFIATSSNTSYSSPVSPIVEGTPLTFNATLPTDTESDGNNNIINGATLTCTWSFGDSSPNVTGYSVGHIYHASGTYSVTATFKDPVVGTYHDSDVTVTVGSITVGAIPTYLGKWEFLMDSTGSGANPVAWRNLQSSSDSWRITDSAFNFTYNSVSHTPWKTTFGVGMALLPPSLNITSLQGDARVMVYSYRQNFGGIDPNNLTKTYTDGHSVVHYPGIREEYTPYLLWKPGETASSSALGVMDYLEDADKTHDDPSAVLHCVGMCLTKDGSLFMAGGERDSCINLDGTTCDTDPTPGLDTGWIFSNSVASVNTYGLWDSQFTLPGYYAYGGTHYVSGVGTTYNSQRYTAKSRRYYPTCIALPNGNTLTVGGDTGTGRTSGEGPLDSVSYDALTYVMTDPGDPLSSPQIDPTFTSYDTDPSLTTYFNEGSQFSRKRYQLGTEYPRLHVISSGKVVYVGQTGFVWELDANDPATAGWVLISQNNTNIADASLALLNKTKVGGTSGDSDTMDHQFAPTVLLPSHNDENNSNPNYLNPSNATQQTLDRVLIVGGVDGSTLYEGNLDDTGSSSIYKDVKTGITDRADIIDFTKKIRYIKESVSITPSPPVPAPNSQIWVPSMPNDDITQDLHLRNAELASERKYGQAILLPNGNVFVVGGYRYGDDNPVVIGNLGHAHTCTTFLFDPSYYNSTTHQLGSWTQTAKVPDEDITSYYPSASTSNGAVGRRMHHSSALLLPSGKVLTVGTTEPAVNPYPTLFTPPILLNSSNTLRTDRPVISSMCEHEVGYGSFYNFTLNYTNTSGSSLASVVMMRPSACTHSCDTEQRLVRCHWATNGTGQLMVTPPYNSNIAPPGWYMVFLVTADGTYSAADWIKIDTTISDNCAGQGINGPQQPND